MAPRRVLITSVFLHPGDAVDRRLQAAGFETVHRPLLQQRTEDELIELLQGVEGTICSTDPFTARVLKAAPQLKVIARTGVGYDAIDLDAATACGVTVCNTPGVNRHAVAEWAMALMLYCSRRMAANMAEVRKGGWERYEGMDLAGKTLGIVGLGAIGKEVAQRARAFEMRLLACDVVEDIQFAEAHGLSYVPLETLLRESDFVTLHLFLNAQTRHLINAERLALMKPTAYLINTSRGGVVDTKALCDVLREQRIAGAALDVFEGEPLAADSPLRELDNAYLSPHMAGGTRDARTLSGATAAENLIRALNGQPRNVVNREVLRSR
ncbi:MAG: phosphoglycerate dehydrogenase [Candidatus Methylomirabilales bacterium]